MHPPAVAAPAAADSGRFEWHVLGDSATGRRYRLYVPGTYDAGRPAPLLVMLHGCTQGPDDFARGTRMNEIAERAGVLVAYPEQPATANPLRCWRWFERAQQRPDGEEVTVIAGIVRAVMSTHAIDARRVHVAGVSAGGAMALLVAATHPELFASVASHSGAAIGLVSTAEDGWALMRAGPADSVDLVARWRAVAGTPTRVVPLLVLHGAADNVVAVRNGRSTAEQWARVHGLAAGRETRTAETDAARATTTTTYVDPTTRETQLEMVIVDGLGHAWSGGSKAGTFTDERGPAASELVMRFLLAHRR